MASTGNDNPKESSREKRKHNEPMKKNENPTKKPKNDELLSASPPHRTLPDKNNEFLLPSPPRPTLPSNGQHTRTPTTSSQVVSYSGPSPGSITSKPHLGSAAIYEAVSTRQGDGIVKRLIDWSESNGDLTINVGLEMKIRSEQLGQSRAMLLLQGELLRNLGDLLLSQFHASLQSTVNESE